MESANLVTKISLARRALCVLVRPKSPCFSPALQAVQTTYTSRHIRILEEMKSDGVKQENYALLLKFAKEGEGQTVRRRGNWDFEGCWPNCGANHIGEV